MAKLQPDLIIGGYQLIRLLGEGGMGEVWLGQDKRADRRVALKFIKPHLLADSGFRTRFSNEARTLGKLEHDRIVTLYSVLDEGDYLALVLRFIDGRSLADKIDSLGPLPLNFIMSCARDILPALGFAHERGIIHRDIKPENILVDARERSFLMDFGIAVAAFAERGTVTGLAIGTPHYMSPEQIRTPRDITTENGGHRTDIYSFGVVLFEMLSGRVPFGQHSGMEDMYAIHHAHCNEEPPRLCEINSEISAAVEGVVLSCLAKDPAQRPQTCMDLLAQLESAALGTDSSPSKSYAKTVIEVRGGSGSKSIPVAAPIVSPARKKVPQRLWYGIGAVCIAGGITATIMTSHHTPTPTPAPHRTEVSSESTATKPNLTKPNGQDVGGTSGVKIKTQTLPPKTTLPPRPVPVATPAGQTPDMVEADKEYQSAKRLFDQGQYCESKTKIDDAIAHYPKPEYTKFQRSAANGCNVQ